MGLLDRIRQARLVTFEVRAGDLTLKVQATDDLSDQARTSALGHWEQLEAYVVRNPSFRNSRVPIPLVEGAPPIVRAMGEASAAGGVGPIVTLPGALVEAVARDLIEVSREVVVASEGDTFVVSERPRSYVVEPAHPEGGIAIRVRPQGPYAFFCSAGRVRVDPVIGNARVVAVLASHGAVADAVGSAMGSAMHRPHHVERALEVARTVEGVRGAVVLAQGRIGVWGDIEIVAPTPR